MVFPAALLSLTLLATAVVAAPSSAERHAARVARREARRGNTIQHVEAPEGSDSVNVEYSSNWAGAVLVANTVSFYCAPIF
jgi:hypothetical protein